jgi:dienelactone hydrolase
MPKLAVVTQQVWLYQVSTDEQDASPSANVSAYLAMPAESGQFPGIIVLQEIFGVLVS